MTVDPQSALRGVRTRLIGAVIAASTTLLCLLYAMLSSLSSFGSTFALTVAMCSFGAAVALLLSARHEEEVHELAAEFDSLHRAGESEPVGLASSERVEQSAGPALPPASANARALPEPHPLEGADLFDRGELSGVSRQSYAGQTDGVI